MRVLVVGSGEINDPQEGYDYLDIEPLHGVNMVQSCVNLENIKSNTYDRVISKDVIEHLPWREVKPAISEWRRVVKDNGVLELETPNAEELVETIINPNNPNLNRWNNESDWERFSRIAYGHQDRIGNYHKCYFTEQWLGELLQDVGFTITGSKVDLFRIKVEATK